MNNNNTTHDDLLNRYVLPKDVKRIESLNKDISEHSKLVDLLNNSPSIDKNILSDTQRKQQHLTNARNVFNDYVEISNKIFITGLLSVDRYGPCLISPLYTLNYDPKNLAILETSSQDYYPNKTRAGISIKSAVHTADVFINHEKTINNLDTLILAKPQQKNICDMVKTITDSSNIFDKYVILCNVSGVDKYYSGPTLNTPLLLGEFENRLFKIDYDVETNNLGNDKSNTEVKNEY